MTPARAARTILPREQHCPESASKPRVRLRVVPDTKTPHTPAQAEQWTIPRTRAECIDAPRPCPFVACRHHLLLSRFSASDRPIANLAAGGPRRPLDTWTGDELVAALARLPATCALDVAQEGGAGLRRIAAVLGGYSRQRVQQIEVKALSKLRREAARRGVRP